MSPPGSLFISSPFEGSLIETGDLFNLEKTMIRVLQKDQEYEVEKLKYKRAAGHAPEDQSQIPTSSW